MKQWLKVNQQYRVLSYRTINHFELDNMSSIMKAAYALSVQTPPSIILFILLLDFNE